MNTKAQPFAALQSVFEEPTQGIVGIVDELLRLCPEAGLRLNWHADRCRITSLHGHLPDEVSIPLRKSVFRGILARIAALCNARNPSAATPYGGHGELVVEGDPPAILSVCFSNTPAEQRLDLRPIPASIPGNGTPASAAAGIV